MILPIVVTFLFTICIDGGVRAAIATESRVFDRNSNYITDSDDKHILDAICCIVSTCDRHNECYGTLKCGYVCSQGSYQTIDYGFTPGFSLRRIYRKSDCYFGLCQDYIFSCQHCPDPTLDDFNVYTVRKDCRDCYYKKN